MSDLTPEQVKAFILIGMFRGRLPSPGAGSYLKMGISEELMARMWKDIQDIELEVLHDVARCEVTLIAHRVKTPEHDLLEAIARRENRELE
jgi:hypothetical protein